MSEETVAKAGTETLNIVNDMLRGLMTEAGKLKDFAVEQLPDVIQQFLQWKFYEHLTYFVLAILIFIVWVIVDIALFKVVKEHGDGDDMILFYGLMGFIPRVAIVMMIVGFINIKWLQIMIAPKAYLLEYAASLVK